MFDLGGIHLLDRRGLIPFFDMVSGKVFWFLFGLDFLLWLLLGLCDLL